MAPFNRNSQKRRNHQDLKMGREAYGIIKEYSEYSTIQGVIYIFQTNQSTFGKIFWIAVVIFMIMLGIYWSVKAYKAW